MTSRDDLVVGDIIFYRPNVLMEVVEVKELGDNKWVNLIEVEYFERNNRVVDLEATIEVPMKLANTFPRKQEQIKKPDNKHSRFLCDEDLVVGDQIYYLHSKGDVLMEVIEVGGEILDRWVKFAEVKDSERKNIFKLPMKTAKTFYRKQ